MGTSLGVAGMVWSSERNEFINEAHAHLAQILQDYNPNLSLVYIPQKDRDATDTKPFAILEQRPGLEPHIVRYMTEVEMLDPTSILAWVLAGDTTKNRPQDILARIEKHEAAEQLMALKKRQEELDDILEFGVFMATGGRNKLHTFKHNGQTYRS